MECNKLPSKLQSHLSHKFDWFFLLINNEWMKNINKTLLAVLLTGGEEWISINIFVTVSLCVCVSKTWWSKTVAGSCHWNAASLENEKLIHIFANVCVYLVRVRCVLELDSLLLLSKWFVFIHRSYVSLLSFTQTQFMASQMWFFRRTVCMVCVVCFFLCSLFLCCCDDLYIERQLASCYDLMGPCEESVVTCYLHR